MNAIDELDAKSRMYSMSALGRMSALEMENQARLRESPPDGYKTIPISLISLLTIGMNIFAVVGGIISLTYDVFLLAIPSGIAGAFAIYMDSIMLWNAISNKYKIRFKDD